ncbi:MAG: Asp-tRNA(Asn)/Glu-tRNA(Gln) amidotransferase subunit GatA, partial [Spirochaetaceae bacterium]|nr:Asp-tRNA(Asn)/Glu-tRNA(Gln) amidotransferase subunit GatA [Spirochaetaceae bacterium]
MALKLPEAYLSYARDWEKRIGAFIEFRPDAAASPNHAAGSPPDGASPVAGLPFAVKDNIAVKDFSLSCGSKLLEKFRSPYTA